MNTLNTADAEAELASERARSSCYRDHLEVALGEVARLGDALRARSVNINDRVRVRLTTFGHEILNKSLSAHRDPDGDILEEQVWVLMRIFGSAMTMGGSQVFQDNRVELVTK